MDTTVVAQTIRGTFTLTGIYPSILVVSTGNSLALTLSGTVVISNAVVAEQLGLSLLLTGEVIKLSSARSRIAWSKIGSADFTIGIDNTAGITDQTQLGDAYIGIAFDKYIVIYGSNSIMQMIPLVEPVPSFGFRELFSFGIKTAFAAAGDAYKQFFVGSDNQLYSIDNTNSITVIGYNWVFRDSETTYLTYNPADRTLTIVVDGGTYIYNNETLTQVDTGISGSAVHNNLLLRTTNIALASNTILVTTDEIYFGVPYAQIESVQILGNLPAALSVTISSFDNNTWSNHKTVSTNKFNAVQLPAYGSRFKISISGNYTAGIMISGIVVTWIPVNKGLIKTNYLKG